MNLNEQGKCLTHRTLKRSETEILANVMIPPAPAPWIALPAKTMGRLMASAQIKLPMRNPKLARRRIGFLPQISLILPQSGTNAAFVRENDEAIHEYPLSDALKSTAIVGRAVEIMVYRYLR
jgi:hypothetical protein